MGLQTVWFIIPLVLIGGIIYSVLCGYIHGTALVTYSFVLSLLNLLYYIGGFFFHSRLRPVLLPAMVLFLELMAAAWLAAAFLCARRQWHERPSTSICLVINIGLILTWNILVYVSYFL